MNNFNVGAEVMTHRGVCIVEKVDQKYHSITGKYLEYTVREKAYKHVTHVFTSLYLDKILPVETEVICKGIRTKIEEVTPHGYKLTGFRNTETNVQKAAKVRQLSANDYKRVKTQYRTGEYPDVIDDENGTLVVPIHARFSYFWGYSRKEFYPAHSVLLV